MDAWVRDQVRLELVEVDIERAIKAQGCRDGGNNWTPVSILRQPAHQTPAALEEPNHRTLSDQAVQVLKVGTLHAEVAPADVVDGLVVDHERAVGMLESGVRGQDRVVRLDDRGSCLRRWVDAELELALFAVVNRQTLHQQGAKSRASSATERVEHQEALETPAVVGHTANLVEDLVDEFLAHRVVSTRVVVGSVLLAADHVLGMKKAAVCAGSHFVDDVGFQVAIDGPRDIFAVAWFSTIWLNQVG